MVKQKTENVKISFYVETKIHDILKEEANKQGRKSSELLKEGLVKILKEYKKDF